MAPPKATKVSSSTKKADHPSYEDMIQAAIVALKDRKGSSRPAIKKYILANYKITPGSHFDTQIAAGIKRGADKGVFTLPKGPSGSVKLGKPEKKATAGEKKVTKVTKAKVAKKAAPKKTTTAKKAAAPKKAAAKKASASKKATASA
ncbi:hypothetical protein K450DRAFT_226187 [Umbelopsis ramanniana AG]|uniref:Histone H1 n=1 Tax=Umbelopsis ramanniana AG TaxID=1314678 RepID=A0AAD5HFN6_UMBRA|nr:uncharacterized protein K450DRAFT_226187 [Umbelopsis ramanniana AG]KAI8582632.1 hypothetical protein K450DRAFT_226187 [Umbelopsis ramanniana AG]